MARISTYTPDAMPHAEDHVIGTNQSPGHSSETVVFSLANISDFILNTNVAESAGTTTVSIGGGDAESGGAVTTPRTFRYDLNYIESNFDVEPVFTITHGLGTSNVHIQIFIDIVDRDEDGNDLGTTTRVLLPPQGSEVDWFATIDSVNIVTIRFAFQVPLVGLITISG